MICTTCGARAHSKCPNARNIFPQNQEATMIANVLGISHKYDVDEYDVTDADGKLVHKRSLQDSEIVIGYTYYPEGMTNRPWETDGSWEQDAYEAWLDNVLKLKLDPHGEELHHATIRAAYALVRYLAYWTELRCDHTWDWTKGETCDIHDRHLGTLTPEDFARLDAMREARTERHDQIRAKANELFTLIDPPKEEPEA
jgi:hypothetical protein